MHVLDRGAGRRGPERRGEKKKSWKFFFVFFRFFLFHFFSFTFFLSFSAHAFPIQFQPLVTQVDPRDIVYSWEADDAAAFAASPEGKGVYPPSSKSSSSPLAPLRIAETKLRCGGFAWGDEDLALLYESRYKDRRSITWAFSPGEAEKEARAGRGSATAAAPASAPMPVYLYLYIHLS